MQYLGVAHTNLPWCTSVGGISVDIPRADPFFFFLSIRYEVFFTFLVGLVVAGLLQTPYPILALGQKQYGVLGLWGSFWGRTVCGMYWARRPRSEPTIQDN